MCFIKETKKQKTNKLICSHFFLGMVFNISIGFTNLKNKNAKEEANKSYGLFLGETVAIGDKDSSATVLTTSKKQMKNIGMFLKVNLN